LTYRRQAGFSLIELMIVVAVAGTVAAVAIPAFLKNAKKAKTIEAANNVAVLINAEITYAAGVGNSSFGSAPELERAGLIGAELASGREEGDNFALNVSADGHHFGVTACPAAINRSGDRCFVTDETGVIATFCPPGQHVDPSTGECVPQDTYFADAGIGMIQAADALSAGMALPAAKALAQLVPTLSQQLLMFMDTNHDLLLTADEILNAEMLGPTLRPLLAPLTDALRRDMALGIANEQVPGVPIAMIGGDLLAYLNRVPPFCPAGCAAAAAGRKAVR
jgi:prepilin-type N-terminal cleavage/methylation domain-containing protein